MMTLILGLDGPQRNIGGNADADGRTVAVLAEQLADRNAELESARRQLQELRRNRPLTAEETAKLNELTRQLAETRVNAAEVEKTAKLPDEKYGELSPADLKRELNAMKVKYEMLQLEAQSSGEDAEYLKAAAAAEAAKVAEAEKELAALRAKSVETGNALTAAERAKIEAEKKLVAAEQRLSTVETEANTKLSATQADLAAQIAVLNRAKTELARKHEELDAARKELVSTQGEVGAYAEDVKKAQLQLSFTGGKLATTEKELAEARGQLERLRRETTAGEIQLADAKRQVSSLQTVLKRAVGDLSNARTEIQGLKVKEVELATTREKLAANSAELTAAREKLAKAEADLRSDVMLCYADSVRTVILRLADRRTLADHTAEITSYLPELEFNGRRYVAGELLTLTEMDNTNSPYSKVYDLEYSVGPADKAAPEICNPKKLLSTNFDPRVALIEVNASSAKPLPVISGDAVKARGIKDLYLFKHTSPGTESTLLDSRISIEASEHPSFMVIRNAGGRSSELAAAPGDFVLTRQGELAGVVVAVEKFDFNTKSEARVSLFPADFNPSSATVIDLGKKAGSEYYGDFIEKMGKLFPAARELTKKQGARK